MSILNSCLSVFYRVRLNALPFNYHQLFFFSPPRKTPHNLLVANIMKQCICDTHAPKQCEKIIRSWGSVITELKYMHETTKLIKLPEIEQLHST